MSVISPFREDVRPGEAVGEQFNVEPEYAEELESDAEEWTPPNEFDIVAAEEAAALEAAPATGAIHGGRLAVPRVPLLASHRGRAPDVVMRWNDMPAAPEAIDVVVHLHGWSRRGMTLPRHIERWSGLDLTPVDGASGQGRSRPTLTVLPRGNLTEKHRGDLYKYDFPAVLAPGALQQLVRDSLERFAGAAGVLSPRVARLILTAHSGGGAAALRLLTTHDPDEVYIFDGLYTDPAPLAAWARRRIARDPTASALRVFSGPSTRHFSRQLADALGGAVTPRHRVESSTLGHWQIPRQYGWRILANAAADVPHASREAPTARELDEELAESGPAPEEVLDFEEVGKAEESPPSGEGRYESDWEEESAPAEAAFEWAEPEVEEWAVEGEMVAADALATPVAEESALLAVDEEAAEVEGAEAESFEEEQASPFDTFEFEPPGADTVTFPSGATLRVVTRSTPEGNEHYDPNGSGNPLLDTSAAYHSTKLAANFTAGELARSGGISFDRARIDPNLVQCLQALRERVRKAVTVTSGYRPYLYNVDVYRKRGQKPSRSQHSSGRAADVKIAGMSGMDIAKAAIDACGGNIGVGIGPDYAHIDVRGTFAKWTYFRDATQAARAIAEITAYQRARGKGVAPSAPPPPSGQPQIAAQAVRPPGTDAAAVTISSDTVARIRRFDPIIDRVASETGVDGNIIRGIIAAESGGNPESGKGTTGYKGLMQAGTEDAELDPAFSIRHGATKFREFRDGMRRRLSKVGIDLDASGREGVLRWVMIGYNAGPATVSYALGYAQSSNALGRWAELDFLGRALVQTGAYSTRAALLSRGSPLLALSADELAAELMRLRSESSAQIAARFRTASGWNVTELPRAIVAYARGESQTLRNRNLSFDEFRSRASRWCVYAVEFKHRNIPRYVDRIVAYMREFDRSGAAR